MIRLADRLNLTKFLAALTILFFAAIPAKAFEEYEEGAVKAALENGETVFLDFYATWCSTCKTQERVISALRSDNPEYDEAIRFIKVNWDKYRDSEIATKYEIPRRSTLVLLRGDEVLGKLVAATGTDDIDALIRSGLKAEQPTETEPQDS